jgi:hypothetical protein
MYRTWSVKCVGTPAPRTFVVRTREARERHRGTHLRVTFVVRTREARERHRGSHLRVAGLNGRGTSAEPVRAVLFAAALKSIPRPERRMMSTPATT